MSRIILKRTHLTGFIACLFAAAVLLVSLYPARSWESALLGLLLASIGSVSIVMLLRQWELHIRKQKPRQQLSPLPPLEQENPFHSRENFSELESALAESQRRQKELIEELNRKTEELHKLEKEKDQFEQRIGDVVHELNSSKSSSEDELHRKTVLLSEYQETINQQRDVIKKKQELVTELESKVRDLNYEVKTLLQLAEIGTPSTPGSPEEIKGDVERTQIHQTDMLEEEEPSPRPLSPLIKSPEEAISQLKRCVDIAQKITGANHFGNTGSRFKEIPIDNRALDLRRLFDSLQSENSASVVVYSQKENKLLFANSQSTNLLGWSSDKFIKDFTEIIAEGADEWKNAIGELSSLPDSRARLLMKTKSGQNLLVHCNLGKIRTGAFRNHIIGVFYPA